MNATELAEHLLRWGRMRRALDDVEAEIKAAVLALGKTQVVGDVRATFSAGRKSYDYETAAVEHPMVSEATVRLFTKTPAPVTDWKAICEHAGIEEIPFTQTAPSVVVKMDIKKEASDG